MNFRHFLLLILTLHFAQWTAEAAPLPLETLQNCALRVPATALTTNGVTGLTNFSPNLMVSAVMSNSLYGGKAALVNTQAWAQRFNDSLYYNVVNVGMAIDHSGSVLVTGTVHYPLGNDVLVTIKYASTGLALWTNRFSGPVNEESFGGSIGIDGSDNVYVTFNCPGFENGNQVALLKYSSSGAAVWTNYFNSSSTNYSENGQLLVDRAGNSYVVIASYSPSMLLPALILKYDTSGTAQWTNVYGGGDYPNAIAVDSNGNLFVAGGVENIGEDYATIKFRPDGTPVWTNRFDRYIVDQPAAITMDSSGNVIVTGDSMFLTNHDYVTIKYGNDGTPKWTNIMAAPGYQGGNVPTVVADLHDNVFITGGSAQQVPDYTNADFTTLKLDEDGMPLWTNRFQELNTGNPAPAGTAVDAAGNFYFCGQSIGPGATNIDFVTIKYLANGTPVWTNRYNGTGNGADYPNTLAVDNAGNVYVTGVSTGPFGVWDFATVKYADCLVYTPPTNYIGTDMFSFVAVDNFGNSATNSVAVAVLPPSLQFNANAHFGAGGLGLRVDGARGSAPVILFRSTNLMDWQPVITNFPALGSAQFLDTNAPGSARAFYRALQLQ